MSCLSATVKAEKEAQVATLTARLTKLEAALSAAIDAGLESYRFDSGEGSQSAKYMKTSDMMEVINFTQSRISRLNAELRGTGVVSASMRRLG